MREGMAEQHPQIGLDVGIADCGGVRRIESAGNADRRLPRQHPALVLIFQNRVARAEFGVAEAGALGVGRRGDVDMLHARLENRGQPVGEAVFDQRRQLILVVTRSRSQRT